MKIFNLICIFFCIFSLGCSTTATKNPSSYLPHDVQFLPPAVTVNLSQKLSVNGYPNQEEFTKILQEKTIEALKKESLLAAADVTGALTVSISVQYQRRFAGEDTPIPSKSVMAPRLQYTIVVTDHGVEKKRIERTGLTVDKGFGENLKSTFTMGLGRTAKDEEQDIQTLANSFALELKKLKY